MMTTCMILSNMMNKTMTFSRSMEFMPTMKKIWFTNKGKHIWWCIQDTEIKSLSRTHHTIKKLNSIIMFQISNTYINSSCWSSNSWQRFSSTILTPTLQLPARPPLLPWTWIKAQPSYINNSSRFNNWWCNNNSNNSSTTFIKPSNPMGSITDSLLPLLSSSSIVKAQVTSEWVLETSLGRIDHPIHNEV
jgi:hypothetical protein